MLEFVWIEEYGVIKNQGFNFNPSMQYSFNIKTKELTKIPHSELPKDFFLIENKTISSISGLVGANGTGKSTVLQFISGFLTYFRPLGGFIVLDNYVINKSDIEIRLSDSWPGHKPIVLNRLDLINVRRAEEGLNKLRHGEETKNNVLGLQVLGNLIKDTRIIYYTGETNLSHTNRLYQSLLSLSDEFESSHFTDVSDIALMANDQKRYRTDKAIYSGENPILAYRSGESERFIELMLSDYRDLIPFPLDSLSLAFSFNTIDRTFFESYDEIAFSPIISLLKAILKNDKRLTPKRLAMFSDIENFGLGGYFNSKMNDYEHNNPDDTLKTHLYHNLLLRHLREQIMESMGELTERNKLFHFLTLLSGIEDSFVTSKSYLDQVKDYFKKTQFEIQNTGSLDIKAVDKFYQSLVELDLWKNDRFTMTLSDLGVTNRFLSELDKFDKNSGLKYKVSSIFDLDMRGLSTGEKQFLKIFSRFLHYRLDNKSNPLEEKNFIILIDEFEIGFHPLWQRKFLKTWITFLERFINKTTKNQIKVQLILTSHSPFVVSDLPKQCINFLSKKKGEKYSHVDNFDEHGATFGANIHELYADSFFLEGALMGDFAKGKIDKLLQDLLKDEQLTNVDYARYIIQNIGEPIIKVKLSEMLAEKLDENVEKARLVAQQEYIINRLKELE